MASTQGLFEDRPGTFQRPVESPFQSQSRVRAEHPGVQPCEPSTVGTRLRGMRRFCRWLGVEGELEIAPTDGIEIPAPPEKPVPILAQEGGRVASMCARRPDRRS